MKTKTKVKPKGKLFVGGEEVNLNTVTWFPVRKKPIIVHGIQMGQAFEVETLEGRMRGKAGDLLLMGIDGELYPCDAVIFTRTYDYIMGKDSE